MEQGRRNGRRRTGRGRTHLGPAVKMHDDEIDTDVDLVPLAGMRR